MKKYILSVLVTAVLFAAFRGAAQQPFFKVHHETWKKSFSFPVFSGGRHPGAATAINQMLQLSELYVLPGPQSRALFATISLNDGSIYGGKVAILGQIKTNTPTCLSLRLEESSCGITCYYWTAYYNFNPGNGDRVQLSDLFTPAGYASFCKQAARQRLRELQQGIAELDSAERALTEGITDCYKEGDLRNFYVEEGTLFIDGDNCFRKNEKFLGIENVSAFPVSSFRAGLNRYGRLFFGWEKGDISQCRSESRSQVFTGRLAGKEVVWVMKEETDGSLNAEYAYTRYGKGIYLTGKRSGPQLQLAEQDGDGQEHADITADFNGRLIKGYWQARGEKTRHPLLLRCH